MKHSIFIFCLLISSPIFAKDKPVNLKSISQMGEPIWWIPPHKTFIKP